MPYYVTGTMHSLIGVHPLLREREARAKGIRSSKMITEVDIPREVCFDEDSKRLKIENALDHFPEDAEYIQGQFSGRVIQKVYGAAFPFCKTNSDPRTQMCARQDKQYQNLRILFSIALHGEHGFTFMQDDEVCALSFQYLPNLLRPQWFVALSRGVNKPPAECHVDILSSETPGGFSGFPEQSPADYQPEYHALDCTSGLVRLQSLISAAHVHDVLHILFPTAANEMSSSSLGVANFDFPHFGGGSQAQPSLFSMMQKLKQDSAAYRIFADSMLNIARHLGASEKGLVFLDYFANNEKHRPILMALKNLIDNPSLDSWSKFELLSKPIANMLSLHQCKHSMLQTIWFGMLRALYTILGLFSQKAQDILNLGDYKKTISMRFFDSGLLSLKTHLLQERASGKGDNYQASV